MSSPQLKKALGQHHLVDGRLCRPLVDYLRPAGERVLEIGPGGGVLTAELIAAGARVWAWELDPEWAFALHGRLDPSAARAALVVGDALDVPWSRLPAPTLVAGNLPYAIASLLILALVRHPERVPRAAFLVQREVGERLAAGPGGRDYGALSVAVQARAEVRLLGRVKAGSFRPPPKVDGVFIGLRPVPPPLPPARMAAFDRTVRQAFAQRRKTLRNSLGAAWGRDEAERVLAAAEVAPGARAETLTLEALLRVEAARAAVLAPDDPQPES